MQTENLSEILQQHPFLAGLSDAHMQTLVGCASNVRFTEGSHLIHEGQVANKFFLIRSGRVALEIDVSPKGLLRIQTVGPGEVLGWSWLVSRFAGTSTECRLQTRARSRSMENVCARNARPTMSSATK